MVAARNGGLPKRYAPPPRLVMPYYRFIGSLLLFAFNLLCAQEHLMYNNWDKEMLKEQDTITYAGYTIVRDSTVFDSLNTIHSVDVFKNGDCVFSTSPGARQRYKCLMGLSPILGNGSKQLVIEVYYDGMECYYYWILSLSDSVEVLYDSNHFPDCELGAITSFVDIDHDGQLEFIQHVDADVFAIFKYSRVDRAFVFSNPRFSTFFDSYIASMIKDLQLFLKSNSQKHDASYFHDLVSRITSIVIQYALSHREQKGWAFFDKWYHYPDKQSVKNTIGRELADSRLYNELHGH
jgi:hypothetical protein